MTVTPAPTPIPAWTLDEFVAAFAGFVDTFEPDALHPADAAAVAAELGRLKRMATGLELLCLTRAAATSPVRNRHDPDGTKWAGQKLGTTPGHAAELLRLADGLDHAPHTRRALLGGEISPEQAAEVVRTEKTAPGTERDMLDQAERGSLTELRRRGRKVRAAATDPDERARQILCGRHLRTWTDDDGAGRGSWNLPPAEHAQVLAVLTPLTDQIFDEARKEGRHEPAEAYRADALVRLATNAITDGTRPGARRSDLERQPATGDDAAEGDGTGGSGPSEPGPSDGGTSPRVGPPSGRPPTSDHLLPTRVGSDEGPAGVVVDAPTPAPKHTAPPGAPPPSTDGGPEGAQTPVGPGSRKDRTGVPEARLSDHPTVVGEGPAPPPGGPDTPTSRSRGRRAAEIVVRVGHRALVAADPDCGAATRGAPLVDDVADVVGVGPVPTAQVLDWMGQGAFVAVVVTTDDDPTRVHTVLHLGTRSPIVDRLWSDRRPSARIGPDRDTRARHVKVLVRITDADLHTPELEPVAAAVAVRGTDVTDLVHRGRRPNAAQRSALQWRSPECTVVGCPNLIRLEVDHVVEWRITHHTTLDELDHLCRHHHRMKTHDGHRLEPGTGKRRLLPPPDP